MRSSAGWLAVINRAQTPTERLAACARLSVSLRYFSRIAVWDYTPAAGAVLTTLLAARLHVGTKDLCVAAVALANGATLLSRNGRDFSRIPGLPVEDWTF